MAADRVEKLVDVVGAVREGGDEPDDPRFPPVVVEGVALGEEPLGDLLRQAAEEDVGLRRGQQRESQ